MSDDKYFDLRNQFAGQAMAALLSQPLFAKEGPRNVARLAFDAANAMIERLNEVKPS